MLTDAVWTKLARPNRNEDGLIALRLHPSALFNVFAALDAAGHRLLLLKSGDAGLRAPKQPLPVGRGFTTRFAVTPTDPDGAKCLQFELTDPVFADVFDVIGNDVLAHVLACTDDTTAFAAFISRIEAWQHFLDGLPRGGLGEQEQLGLFAELWFLNEFLLAEVGAQRAVRAWAGPQALAKDFQLPGVSFEVKASIAKQHTKLYISNEMQLDARGGRLILYCLLLERVVAGGMSLPDLVATVRDKLLSADPASAIRFAELLLQAGYHDADMGASPARFLFRSAHFYSVDDRFPRIIETDLRPGVGDVRYSILRSECERHAISEAEARQGLQTAT